LFWNFNFNKLTFKFCKYSLMGFNLCAKKILCPMRFLKSMPWIVYKTCVGEVIGNLHVAYKLQCILKIMLELLTHHFIFFNICVQIVTIIFNFKLAILLYILKSRFWHIFLCFLFYEFCDAMKAMIIHSKRQ
jgi:hypothetical protein